MDPVPETLRHLRTLLRPDARLILLLNYSVFEDHHYTERLGLPDLDEEHVASRMLPAYEAAGLQVLSFRFCDSEPPHRTTWGQRLYKGSGRRTLWMEATTAQAPLPAPDG